MEITAKSYFSGAGGMDLGIQEAGINILESYEIDKKCCETLRKNFNHKVNEADITKITVLDQQDILQQQILVEQELGMIFSYISLDILLWLNLKCML